ncbi:hypothetical protein N7466_000311 [Penicillium verhagenii]|uniref:uncharacterized protein n=1 Tax=Penicillium verhagenii TaxID=1562060 RepID=UPI002544DC6E|nr:uncharacterized protein N7466_000311 [Penicillium verhagenii]KAJ5947296.1 hypothetical protein N7466_000311 [Penicillium verhagenii]
MQFITIFIATLAAVASASQTSEKKRSCVASEFIHRHKNWPRLKTSGTILTDYYEVACNSGNACCDGWQCVGATEWNAGVCIPNY